MALKVDPGLAALFGSEDRVRTLAALANADAPLTAYRVAILVGVRPPNVYRELKRLLRVNEVERARTPEGREGWRLLDAEVRTLLRRRVRVSWSEDQLRGARARGRRASVAIRRSARAPLDLSRFAPGRPPSTARRRQRSAKDRVLAGAGARTSVRSTDATR